MPLIERKPFKRIKPPKDLHQNEELFYIVTTQEVFRNYNDFFERVILINSLIWSCSLTGKSGLTYQEAVDSETEALENLKTFPHALRKPLLYLASLTDRKRLNDLCDDVFNYVKDRYFIGEEVDVTVNGTKRSCEVTQVILPERVVKSPVKAENSKPRKQKDVAPSKIKYEVVDYGSGRTSVVKSECLSRPKSTYTKPRNKLFLKQHTQPKNGSWKIKESVSAKQELDEFNFGEVHCGPLPSYAKGKPPVPKKSASSEKAPKVSHKKITNDQSKKTVQGKLNFKKESADDKKKNVDKEALEEKKRIAEEKERQKIRDNIKKQLEEEKEKQRLEKINERLKRKEEKRIMAEYMSSWKKPRDDLECDDLKELPVPMPIDCGIPQSCFGDAVMILEFLSTFEKQVAVKDIFPQGCTFEHIEKALIETDIQGVFNDLLQLFLTAIFRYQEAEDDVVDLKDKSFEGIENLNLDKAAEIGTIVSTWPLKYQGTALRNIPLDSFSITEVLRLHILSSGGKTRFNWQGISTRSEDPALFFKVEEAELLKKLEMTSVFDLDCEERCKIISLLMNQLLNGDVLKYAVDENADKTRPLRHQLKQLRWAYSRKEKEDTLNKKKVKEIKEVGNPEEPSVETLPIINVEEEEKENTDNLTPEEIAQLEEKKAKESAKQKAEFQRKEREIELQIRKLQSSFNVVPLGKDRAYRRYWVFQTVPGIFVEDDDPFKGACLPKLTIQNSYPNSSAAKSETSTTNIKKYFQSMDTKSASSDKENEILREIAIVQSEFPFPTKNRKLTDLNPRVDSKKGGASEIPISEEEGCLQCKNKIDMQEDLNWYCPHSKNTLPTDQCSSNIDTCPVHNLSAPRMRWAFYYKEDDIDNLITSLNPRGFRERSLKEALLSEKEHLKETLSKCPYNSFNKTLIPEVRKSQRLQYPKSSYADMSPRQALELTIRDMVLELEHRISAGGLGSLKIQSAESWRTQIEQGALQLQIDGVKNENCDATVKDEIVSDIKKLTSPIPYEQVIKDLALATLQLSQGIEAKYLNSPLGESDDKKSKQKVSEESESQKKKSSPVKKSSLERWQESLLQCASLSQLYVHLGTLERSVAWSRSVLKAHCRICRRRGDGENMLLCDGCNRGHHLYCLKPPLKAIPEGDWYCLSCKPAEKPVSPQKKVRKVESDSEEEQSEEEEESGEEEVDSEFDADSSVANSTLIQESCEACGDVGTLLCCDRCPLMYHAECVNLKRIPRGEWLCPKCNKKDEAVKKAQKHPASGSYGTRSSSLTAETKKNPLKNKPATKGTKRKYEDSFEEEFEPPLKKSNRERRSRNEDTESEENPFRKVYKDSALNAARRRSKTGNGGDMLDYKACIDLLVELMRHPSSWPFLVPVSKKDAPDYHLIIKRPMDFGTIRSKLNYMSYKNNEDFVRDLYLVLQNCEWFNPKGSPEFKASQILYKEVKRLLEEYHICNPFASGRQIPNVNEV